MGERDERNKGVIVIQAAGKGGAIAEKEKAWYGEKMKEQILEGWSARTSGKQRKN